MQYRDAVRYLYSLGNEVQTAKLGLDRISALLDALGNPHKAFRSVHIAGTNGKGSTSAMIEAGLRTAGIRTGLYTSPHLIEPTERIRIAGDPVSETAFSDAFEQVHTAAEGMLSDGRIDLHPTYFESVTAMAFLLFRDSGVETAVIETGLGGRLDATNVIRPAASVITQIDYDHQHFLGDTIEQIAGEKAGILKPDVFAVFARQRPEAQRVLMARADELLCPILLTSDWPVRELELRPDGCRIQTSAGAIDCPLAGEHQVENALAAAITLDLLQVDFHGIENTYWPARLERIHTNPDMIVDGAHNPAGARALAAYIERFYPGRPIWLVFGAMRDKAISEMIGILLPLAQRAFAVRPDNVRAMPAEEIRAFDPARIEALDSVPEAVTAALAAPAGTAVFFAGSLFLAGEARAILGAGRP